MTAPTFVDFKRGDDVVASITHSDDDYLMWEAAGLYLDDPHNQWADGLETDLVYALQTLRKDPDYFRLYNNAIPGAGTYESVLDFLEKLREACEDFPTATIEVRN